MRTIGTILALLAGLAASPASAQTRSAPEGGSGAPAAFEPRPVARAEGGMVVAANPLAAEAGAAVLRAGGSAVDAAIATQLVLNVVEPQSSGLGGGAFALHWDAASKTLTSWDGRETAPSTATPELFLDADGEPVPFLSAVVSGRSVGAPGLPRLMAELHARYGRTAWPELFKPAETLARDGFPVSPRLAALLNRFQARLKADPAARALYLDASGAPLAVGAALKNPALAETLARLAEEGPDGFYSGPIAEAIVAAVAVGPGGGALSLDDLGDYEVVERAPLCVAFRQRYEICGMGPPSSGASTVGQILGLYERVRSADAAPDPIQDRHLFLEASRLAYADRARYLADPDFVETPARGLLEAAYLNVRATEISAEAPSREPAAAGVPAWREGALQPGPDPTLGRPGTTHLSVVDRDGNIVSWTASIESAFGSGRMAAGFLLNNQLTDFAFRPMRDGRAVANRVEPRKRPRSSMSPTIVFERDGEERRPVLALGSPGGSRIPEYVATALIGLIDHDADPALAAARAHVSHRNRDAVQVEGGAAQDALAEGLAARGYALERPAMTSGLHIIRIEPNRILVGGADPRREGRAVGVAPAPAPTPAQ
ncbi:MAG: gamma-glutamyltransferase [Pseudomonadota bacterium]